MKGGHAAGFAVAGGGGDPGVTEQKSAQIFSPPGAPFVCFEPMTAPANALRSGDGLRRVAQFSAAFAIEVATTR